MKLLQIILILMLVYYGFKLFFRIVFPLLIKRFIKKSHERFQKRYHSSNKNQEDTKHNKNEDLNTENSGEYVDFEEVE